MAIALAITPDRTRKATSFALTGATASTNYIFQITTPMGSLQLIPAKTDGSGNVTVTAVMCEPGSGSCSVVPATTAASVGPVTFTSVT